MPQTFKHSSFFLWAQNCGLKRFALTYIHIQWINRLYFVEISLQSNTERSYFVRKFPDFSFKTDPFVLRWKEFFTNTDIVCWPTETNNQISDFIPALMLINSILYGCVVTALKNVIIKFYFDFFGLDCLRRKIAKLIIFFKQQNLLCIFLWTIILKRKITNYCNFETLALITVRKSIPAKYMQYMQLIFNSRYLIFFRLNHNLLGKFHLSAFISWCSQMRK